MAVLVKGLFKGVTPPSDYVPYHLRTENERKAKEAAEQRRIAEAQKKKAEEEAYNRIAAEFDALPEQDKEMWVNRAKAKLSPVLRSSKYAVRSIAIELFRGG
jgi:FtsZ-interacting cell division protein YlmF